MISGRNCGTAEGRCLRPKGVVFGQRPLLASAGRCCPPQAVTSDRGVAEGGLKANEILLGEGWKWFGI